MNPDLWIALQITLIGMSVVFGCILLLWLLMILLVRWTSKEEMAAAESEPQTDRKQLAAIVAVSVALARRPTTSEPQPFPPPQTTIVSAWQAVTRANHLRRRGPLR